MKLAFAEDLSVNQERMTFVGIAALTIVLMYFISAFLSSTSSSGPLQRKIQDMEKQLSSTLKELALIQGEVSARKISAVDINENNPELKENEMKLEEARQELHSIQEQTKHEELKAAQTLQEFEITKQEIQASKDETRQAEEMAEELMAEQRNETKGSSEELLDVIKQLQTQFEQQKAMLAKYEPKLKKKDKENKELSLVMRQLRADAANAQLEADKLKKELSNVLKQEEETSSKVENVTKNDDEWKSLANLLQKQLDDKCDEGSNIETKTEELKQRLADIEKNLESQDLKIEVNEEVIKELRKKQMVVEEKDGWEVEGDGWNEMNDESVSVDDLKSENDQILSEKESLEGQIAQVRSRLSDVRSDLDKHRDESSRSREERDKVIREFNENEKKLEVLTEFFNKKEAELQKQIGLQSAKFGDVNLDAENTTKRLEIVTEELKTTRESLHSLKKELEDRERFLKAGVGDQEKKAHECWVSARQAERKVAELQSETSVLKSRLTIAESKNDSLEKEKGELEGAIKSMKSVKSESGADSCSLASSTGLPSLPPLPGFNSSMADPGLMMAPGMMMPGGLMSMRPAPLGEISPSPRTSRRSRSSRSPSPPYSPRSERRYSPARSDRGGYRDYRYQEKGGRRHEEPGGRRYRRDDSPRSERSDRYSDRETEYTRGSANTGPMMSSTSQYRV